MLGVTLPIGVFWMPPDAVNAPVLALNVNLVIDTLGVWFVPVAPTITGYNVVVVLLSVATTTLLGPVGPCGPVLPIGPCGPCGPTACTPLA